jgi:hypothetical protein
VGAAAAHFEMSFDQRNAPVILGRHHGGSLTRGTAAYDEDIELFHGASFDLSTGDEKALLSE